MAYLFARWVMIRNIDPYWRLIRVCERWLLSYLECTSIDQNRRWIGWQSWPIHKITRGFEVLQSPQHASAGIDRNSAPSYQIFVQNTAELRRAVSLYGIRGKNFCFGCPIRWPTSRVQILSSVGCRRAKESVWMLLMLMYMRASQFVSEEHFLFVSHRTMYININVYKFQDFNSFLFLW